MKELVEVQKSESEVSKINPRFKKNPEGPKMDQKSLIYGIKCVGCKISKNCKRRTL